MFLPSDPLLFFRNSPRRGYTSVDSYCKILYHDEIPVSKRRKFFSAKMWTMWNTNTQISIFDAVLNTFSLHALVKPLFHFPLLPRPKLVTDSQLLLYFGEHISKTWFMELTQEDTVISDTLFDNDQTMKTKKESLPLCRIRRSLLLDTWQVGPYFPSFHSLPFWLAF